MRSFRISLLLCLMMTFSLSAQQNKELSLVHKAWKNFFTVDNYDLFYEDGDTNYWIALG